MPATRPALAGATLQVVDGGHGRLLTVRAVAARLAVSRATVYGLCERGELGQIRVGNAIRLDPSEVEAFKARRGKRGRHAPVAQPGGA